MTNGSYVEPSARAASALPALAARSNSTRAAAKSPSLSRFLPRLISVSISLSSSTIAGFGALCAGDSAGPGGEPGLEAGCGFGAVVGTSIDRGTGPFTTGLAGSAGADWFGAGRDAIWRGGGWGCGVGFAICPTDVGAGAAPASLACGICGGGVLALADLSAASLSAASLSAASLSAASLSAIIAGTTGGDSIEGEAGPSAAADWDEASSGPSLWALCFGLNSMTAAPATIAAMQQTRASRNIIGQRLEAPAGGSGTNSGSSAR